MFAAASLTEAFTAAGLDATYNFAGSGTLVTQIQQGAPADVIATADTSSMQKLVDANLVDTPTVFARNALAILVAPGNPKDITTLADLTRADVSVVLADASVPAGRYAEQVLEQAGVTVNAKSLETDVKAAVARVASGDADAAIVYATDVRAAGPRAFGVDIPAADNVVAEYPIAIVKTTSNRTGAQTFIEAVVNGAGRAALEQAGFAVP